MNTSLYLNIFSKGVEGTFVAILFVGLHLFKKEKLDEGPLRGI